MVSYPSLNLTVCPEDEQTHGPGHPSLKESPDHCLEKKRENGCFVSRKWWVLRKKKPIISKWTQCPLRLLAASLAYMSSVLCHYAKSCVKCIKEMYLKIPSLGQVKPVHKAYDRKEINSMNSGTLRREEGREGSI